MMYLPQNQANSAALYFFRCTLCNNSDEFQQEMLRMGIHIPERCFLFFIYTVYLYSHTSYTHCNLLDHYPPLTFMKQKKNCLLEMRPGSWNRMHMGNYCRCMTTVMLLNVSVKKVVITVHIRGKQTQVTTFVLHS